MFSFMLRSFYIGYMLKTLHTHRKKIAVIVSGHSIWYTVSWLYDHMLYPAVLAAIGYVWGGALMTVMSFIICGGMLLHYHHKKIDWVGASYVETFRTSDHSDKHFTVRFASWAVKKGDGFMFLFLTIFKDPFIAIAYLTRGKFEKITPRTWLLFSLSILVANLYWIITWGVVIEFIKAVFSL